ncbi:matrilin-2-like [Sphaeramia orbicularis]|uniref:matrilin-2-like n=1 Tax=Sphaeramia orbicularis TaxID=375764 RepID=UPI00117E2E0A|nr:matrilin-2 [Sphaeramia orbicularis]XP_030013511.1 matrilin-2 [Sphaeramia orbicularis]
MRSLVLGLFCLLCCDAFLFNRRRPKPLPGKTRNETTVQPKPTDISCKPTPLDFVFVIDSSRSIRPDDYEKVKTFIINLLQFLTVAPDATRVGLLQYGSEVQNEFSLKTYSTRAEVEQAVRNMEHLATGTMTGLAIQYTMETAFTEEEGARPKELLIPRIAMIVTDGRPQDTVEEVAAQARQSGIQIFAIGVGRVDMNTLKAIGSEPHSEHVHLVANFSQIQTLTSVFQSKLCGGSDMCEVVDHRCQHICVSSPASYRCKCRKGFILNPDGKTCKAEDMCAEVDHGCQHICANIPDGYECRCRPGYQLTVDMKTCNRIDYCDLGNHGCEQDCVSIPESYICRCSKGYVLNPDGKTCRKIDHCADGTHGCEQEFMNTDKACVCKCRKGYTLRRDGKTCKKIDHCADGKHGCEQEFMNTEDACVCKCREGFTLRPDGKTCQSLDLCQTIDHSCEHLCVNTNDSYVCRCFEGFILAEDGKSCKKSECGDGVMDLVFVIDGSKSLGPTNFELVKQFVNSIVDSLDISRTGTHVGLLQYSTKVRSEFTLGQFTSAQDVKQAVSRIQYMGRGSMTGSALRHMFEVSFSSKEGARSNIPRVSIVFTDGRSQDDVSEWASKAKNSGVTIYALGVGKAIEQELREIASEPDEKHLYYAEGFEKMGEITKKLKSSMCIDKPDEIMCKCENVMMFQKEVNEKLKDMMKNIEAMSKRLETLENQVVRK